MYKQIDNKIHRVRKWVERMGDGLSSIRAWDTRITSGVWGADGLLFPKQPCIEPGVHSANMHVQTCPKSLQRQLLKQTPPG